MHKSHSKLTLFLQGFTVDPHVHSGPQCNPSVLQGHPRFEFPLRFVEQVLLQEQDTRFSYKFAKYNVSALSQGEYEVKSVTYSETRKKRTYRRGIYLNFCDHNFENKQTLQRMLQI